MFDSQAFFSGPHPDWVSIWQLFTPAGLSACSCYIRFANGLLGSKPVGAIGGYRICKARSENLEGITYLFTRRNPRWMGSYSQLTLKTS